ncbi:ATP-binding protein [Cesiribacter sp. SM1]|uniref:ATP-binding protein n=1 Tax=Cesiribacter sp. SM1 TaxID=2861196 RepID=UPI001CD68179|nr:ATP-binding protein [Cesiribacter sp. SM1]
MVATTTFEEQEDARLQELLRYAILDTPQEQDFEDVVKLVSYMCEASIGLVSFIDECRQWFKAKVGWEQFETSREIAFCAYTIRGEGILEVPDTLLDERFKNNPLVTSAPGVRFYAGVPLVSPRGYKLGTLCVLDHKPRKLSDKQVFGLVVLSKYIIKLLELRLNKQNLLLSQQQHSNLQEEMQRQQHALTRAQSAASIGMFELDLKTNLIQASEGFANLFGLKLADAYLTDEVLSCIHPDDEQAFREYFNNLLKSSEKRLMYDYRCKKKNSAQEVCIRTTGEIIRNRAGEPLKIIGIKQDITEQKGYEKKLEDQNAELIKVNEELDNFVYRVSHDLRAPISSLLGLVEVISAEQDISTIKEMLLLVKKTLEKQDKFIKDILDYSRNARQEVQFVEINFNELLEEVFSPFAYSQPEKAEYSFDVEQDAPFYTDDYRLSIILNNLVSNAFKYLKLNRENSYVKVYVKANRAGATIVVEDNGIGIEKKHQEKVFNMFYRATDQHPGSGLGLYIVKETVSKLKGTIGITSESGYGTTITVELPNLAPNH